MRRAGATAGRWRDEALAQAAAVGWVIRPYRMLRFERFGPASLIHRPIWLYGVHKVAVGDSVKGGVYGDYPSLSEDRLVLDGNMDVTTDFRSLYSTVIANYLDGDPVPSVGGNFPRLGFI